MRLTIAVLYCHPCVIQFTLLALIPAQSNICVRSCLHNMVTFASQTSAFICHQTQPSCGANLETTWHWQAHEGYATVVLPVFSLPLALVLVVDKYFVGCRHRQ